jgi:two-component system, LuxR family, response regulator DctR
MNNAEIWVVDDEPIVREALAWLLRTHGYQAQQFDSGEAFLAALQTQPQQQAACVLLDVRMGGASGIEVFGTLLAGGWTARLPVIFLTGHGDIPMAVDAVKRGAFDFFEKPFDDNALVQRIGQAVEASAQTLLSMQTRGEVARRFASLSERERQVMELVLAGRLNKQIADDLQIAMRTVEVHRSNVFTKMGVRSAVELAQVLAVLK